MDLVCGDKLIVQTEWAASITSVHAVESRVITLADSFGNPKSSLKFPFQMERKSICMENMKCMAMFW